MWCCTYAKWPWQRKRKSFHSSCTYIIPHGWCAVWNQVVQANVEAEILHSKTYMLPSLYKSHSARSTDEGRAVPLIHSYCCPHDVMEGLAIGSSTGSVPHSDAALYGSTAELTWLMMRCCWFRRVLTLGDVHSQELSASHSLHCNTADAKHALPWIPNLWITYEYYFYHI